MNANLYVVEFLWFLWWVILQTLRVNLGSVPVQKVFEKKNYVTPFATNPFVDIHLLGLVSIYETNNGFLHPSFISCSCFLSCLCPRIQRLTLLAQPTSICS